MRGGRMSEFVFILRQSFFLYFFFFWNLKLFQVLCQSSLSPCCDNKSLVYNGLQNRGDRFNADESYYSVSGW